MTEAPELLQREEVGVDPAAADDVAARRRQGHVPKRASIGPASRIEARIRAQSSGSSGLGSHARGHRPAPSWVRSTRPGAEVDQEREHGLDVPDARDVVEIDRTVGQDGGGEDGQRGVLVAGRAHGSAQRTSAVHEETRRHGQS